MKLIFLFLRHFLFAPSDSFSVLVSALACYTPKFLWDTFEGGECKICNEIHKKLEQKIFRSSFSYHHKETWLTQNKFHAEKRKCFSTIKLGRFSKQTISLSFMIFFIFSAGLLRTIAMNLNLGICHEEEKTRKKQHLIDYMLRHLKVSCWGFQVYSGWVKLTILIYFSAINLMQFVTGSASFSVWSTLSYRW